MDEHNNIWKETLERLRTKVSTANFSSFLKPTKLLQTDDHNITLGVPNKFVRDWIFEYYTDLITQEIFTSTQKTYNLKLEIVASDQTELEEAPEQDEPPVQTRPTPPTPTSDTGNLNKKYSFDRFVVGSSNQFAHAAAMAAADLPGGHYNPLFIYGGVGLGKTHILNAVGFKILSKFPGTRILYLSAEQFMNEMVFCIRFEKMDQFRKKYRESCDVLLVDDVQFLVGKEGTQQEFFHTFNALYETQRQIVVTSDKFPKDLDGMEERLRSRFEWGLIADIQPPDLETRIAILKKKAELNKIFLSDDVALFLANQVRSNVRELEGSLIRLGAFSSLEKRIITVDLAKEVLKNIIKERVATCSIESIQRTVSDFYHIKPSDIKSVRRLKSISAPRQVAMYLCRKHLKSSYPEIGAKFGGKDHSTVIYAVNKIGSLLEKDSQIRLDIDSIEKSLLN